MKRTIKLTESDLHNIIKRAIHEATKGEKGMTDKEKRDRRNSNYIKDAGGDKYFHPNVGDTSAPSSIDRYESDAPFHEKGWFGDKVHSERMNKHRSTQKHKDPDDFMESIVRESVRRILEGIDGDNHIFEVQDITPDMLEHLWVFETGDSYYEFEANYGWVTFRGVYASDGLHVDEVIIGHSGAGRQMDNIDLQSGQFEQWFNDTLKDSLTQKVEMKIDNGDFSNESDEY